MVCRNIWSIEVSALVLVCLPPDACAALRGDDGCVCRGMGRQAELMVICMVGFWGVGVMLGASLTFWIWHWGIVGLWLGITAGVLATGALSCRLHCFFNACGIGLRICL